MSIAKVNRWDLLNSCSYTVFFPDCVQTQLFSNESRGASLQLTRYRLQSHDVAPQTSLLQVLRNFVCESKMSLTSSYVSYFLPTYVKHASLFPTVALPAVNISVFFPRSTELTVSTQNFAL